MPFYRRRYRRRYRPRRYIRRWFRRRFRRYVNGSSKSTVRMKTAVEYSGNLSVPDATHLSNVFAANAFAPYSTQNSAISVLNSPLYRTYCNLYEECKCIGMKVNLSIASQIGGTALPSLQIYTAWDRRHGTSEASYTAQEIKDSSTYNVATALNNNVAKLTRSIYASDLMEKAQWHDCTLATAGVVTRDAAYVAAGDNPNFFSPCFFFCFGSPSLSAAQSPATVSYQISVVYYFAFRNPKYGASSASSSKLVDLGGVSGDAPRPDDDGDMDVVVPVRAPVAAAADLDDEDDLDQDIIDAQAARASAASARERPQRQSIRARPGDPVGEDERRAIGIRNAQRQANFSANRSRALDDTGDLNE